MNSNMNSNMNRTTLTIIGVQGKSASSMNKVKGFILPNPFMLMGGVALTFGITTMLFWNLYRGALNDYNVFQAKVEAAMGVLHAQNERKQKDMVEATRRATKDWTDAANDLRRSPRIRVQPQPRCSAGGMSAVSATPQGLNVEASQLRFDPGISVAECEKRVNNAVQDTTRLVHLQNWITKTHEASK